ncbi:MAG: zinc-ribbon domain-containing protein [Clostridia bacterium]|nr:zinc-ribbon domain-containing protein [Clostridia bacterium]
MFCPKCGTVNADGAKFCLKCGASLIPEEAKPAEAPAEEKPVSEKPALESKWPKLFWILSGAGFALGLLSGIIIFFSNLIYRWRWGGFGDGISSAFKTAFSGERIFIGLCLIAAVAVFFIPATKKYPYITAIPRAALGLVVFIASISGLVKVIRSVATAYSFSKPGLAIAANVLWVLAGVLFLLTGAACLLAILLRKKLEGKEKLAVIILGGATLLMLLIGILAALLELIYGVTTSAYSTFIKLSIVLLHTALLGPTFSVLLVNLDQFGMSVKDLKTLFKKETPAA